MKKDLPDLEFILAGEKASPIDLLILGLVLLTAGTFVIAALIRVFSLGL